MNLDNKKIVVIGGAGLIGSHTVDQLLKEKVKEILIYDNMTRGSEKNLQNALSDKRVKICDIGGDILQTDILDKTLEGADGVFILLHYGFCNVMNFLEQLLMSTLKVLLT